MNADRRKFIETALNKLDEIKSDMEGLAWGLACERDAFDNLSEGLQGSAKGEAIEQAADALDEAVDAMDTALGALQLAIGE